MKKELGEGSDSCGGEGCKGEGVVCPVEELGESEPGDGGENVVREDGGVFVEGVWCSE